MAETLLTASSIKLYGRVVNSLQYADDTATTTTNLGSNSFLQHQLSVGFGANTIFTGTIPTFATGAGAANRTITAIVVTNGPSIAAGMLVTGLTPAVAGTVAGNPAVTAPSAQIFSPGTYIVSVTGATMVVSSNPLVQATQANCAFASWSSPVAVARIYAFSFEGAVYTLPSPSMFLVHGSGQPVKVNGGTGRSTLEISGVAAREWEFADSDFVYWEYEKGDFSMRFDAEAGQFEQILLAAALRAGADMADRATRSGASLSGASLAGASLSGASLSGASLSGASLSGASLRNGR